MTLILLDRETIILKTFKTGSTSLHQYLSSKLLDYQTYNYYTHNKRIITKDFYFTSWLNGHESLEDLKNLGFNITDFSVIYIIRHPYDYCISCFNQIIHEMKYNNFLVKLFRKWYFKKRKLAFFIYYFIFTRLSKKHKIKLSNYNLIKNNEYNNLIIIDYNYINDLQFFIKEFNPIEFSFFKYRNYVKYDYLKSHYRNREKFLTKLVKFFIKLEFKKEFKILNNRYSYKNIKLI